MSELSDKTIENVGKTASVGATTLAGGGTGAVVGTLILPGVGTAIGYLMGTGLGAASGARLVKKLWK